MRSEKSITACQFFGRSCVVLVLAGLLARVDSGASQNRANTADEHTKPHSSEVVVTAKRLLTDEQVTQRVENVLADDPYIYAEHITVSTNNGVVTLEGIVGDVGELVRVLRLCRKTSGSKRLVNHLEINNALPDGG